MDWPKIIWVNLKHHYLPQLAMACILFLAAPVLFNIHHLDAMRAARPIEMVLILTGMVLLTPIFQPEQQPELLDVIRSKRCSYYLVCMIRILYSVLTVMVLVVAFVWLLKYNGSNVTRQHFLGGFVTAVYFGVIGMMFAGITGNVICGYMVDMVYYILSTGMKEKLGKFFLFSMSMGGRYEDKYWLVLFSILGVMVAFAVMKGKQRR